MYVWYKDQINSILTAFYCVLVCMHKYKVVYRIYRYFISECLYQMEHSDEKVLYWYSYLFGREKILLFSSIINPWSNTELAAAKKYTSICIWRVEPYFGDHESYITKKTIAPQLLVGLSHLWERPTKIEKVFAYHAVYCVYILVLPYE